MENTCENCKKWLRINQFKGYCADVMNWYDTTYQEDWCEYHEKTIAPNITITNKHDRKR